MYQKATVFILIAVTMLMTGCSILPEFLREVYDKPVITFEGMSLKNMSLFEVTPVFNFKVTNPNPVSIEVRNVSYDLKINHKKFVKGVSDKGLRVKAVGSEAFELPVTFNYPDVFESVAELVKSDEVVYDLSGFVAVGPYTLPYRTKGELNLPALPEVFLKHIEVSALSSSGASLVFLLGVKNNNPFSVMVNELEYQIKLGEKEFANGIVRNISSIEKNSTVTIKVVTKTDFPESEQSVCNIVLTAPSSKYELSGLLRFYVRRLGEKIFPFQKVGNATILQNK
ncbi:MAG: hypothetical protein GY795_44150 [Desulfobacterales bacterium]|nr:hypothetical protein [Desulfobacterales bacterium]